MSTMKCMWRTYTNCIIKLLNLTADLLKLRCCSFKMLRNNIAYCNITACSCCCKHKSTSLDLIRNNRILCTMKSLNTTDADHISTCTLDISTHTVQEIGNINNMRLSCSILDNCTACCHGSCHHDIDSRADRNHIQEDMTSMKILSPGNDSTMENIHLSTKSTKSFQMLVDRSAADITSARKRNFCMFILSEQCTQKII